ncbi:hypothetical protein SprV_0301361600 [Sparganum proliferum]
MSTSWCAVADAVVVRRRAHWDPCRRSIVVVVVGQKPGYLLRGPGGVEWNATVRARPRHPPAPSAVSGLLDSVLTPGPEEFSLASHPKEPKPSRSSSSHHEPFRAPPYSAATLVAATSPTNPFVDPPFPHPPPAAPPPTDRVYTSGPSPLLAPDVYEPGRNIRDWLCDLDLFLTDVPPHQHTCFLLRFLSPSARRRAFDARLTPATPFPIACRCVLQLFETSDAPGIAAEHFATLRQAPRQSVDDFATELTRLASAAFPNLPHHDRDDLILHRFISGLIDRTITDSFLLHPPRTLNDALRQCRLYLTYHRAHQPPPRPPLPPARTEPQAPDRRTASPTTTPAASTAQLLDPELATVATTHPSTSVNGNSHSASAPPAAIDDFDLMYNSVLSAVALDPIPLDTVLPAPSVIGPAAYDQLKTLLNSFPDLFAWSTDTIGRTHLIKHTIDTGDAKPVWQPPRRIPVRYREEVNKMLDELLKAKIIQPSSSPLASPIALVPKKDGSVRLCIDYRRLNAVTVRDPFLLRLFDDTIDALGNAAWFSTLDLKSGYWQVEIHPDDRHKTPFTVPQGLFEFQTLPFDLCNAAATFQRLMYRVLQLLIPDKCLVYLDDIIVFGRSTDEHNHNLRAVLEALRSAGLTLNPTKCLFYAVR